MGSLQKQKKSIKRIKSKKEKKVKKQERLTAEQVAKWFIDNAQQEAHELTHSKMQGLLYYAKGFNYVFTGKPLYNEGIVKTENAPIVEEIYKLYDSKTFKRLEGLPTIDDEITSCILEFVNLKAGSRKDEELLTCIRGDKFWEVSKNGEKLNEEDMRYDFRGTYLCGVKPNNLDIKDDDITKVISDTTLIKNREAYAELKYL